MKTVNERDRSGPSQEWLARMGEVESGCAVAAGGLAAELGFLGGPSIEPSIAFGKLVELARRSRGETVEALAKRAGLELGEVLAIEMGEGVPTPRGVFQIAQAFRFSAGMLMELAGLAKVTNPILKDAALRFAASSEPTTKLSPEEKDAFETFVRVVAEKPAER